MKKIIVLISMILLSAVLVACNNTSKIDFTAVVPSEVTVGDSFTITAKDLKDNPIEATLLSVTVKSGASLVTVNGLTVEAIAAGSVTITVVYATKDQTKSKDFTIVINPRPVVYGLPEPAMGYYMKDADIIQEGTNRYLVYTTNASSGEEDNVIALRKGVFSSDNGYAYGAESVILTPSASGWDQFISAPSIVKGNFNFNNASYSYLMAYQGTNLSNERSFSIGLAVSNNPEGSWIKVGTAPVLAYNRSIYGESYAGFYAPSLVNLNKDNVIRLFFTWADAFGHFSYFVDFNASNLSNIDLSGYAMVPNNGNLSTGEDVTMIPNADFAYDAVNDMFYMVKDYSPTPSREPRVATRIELARIAEAELYSAKPGLGWASLRLFDMFDTPDTMYERLYSATLISDEYGHVISIDEMEIVYTVSDLEADNVDYIFSQHLLAFIYE